MQFKVPQFLEREARIAGPLTFKALAVFGGVGAVLLILYFIIPRGLFILCSVVLVGGTAALLFLKIEGVRLYEVVYRCFGFYFKPKIYIWQRKIIFTPIQWTGKKEEKREEEEKATLQFSPRGKLSRLGTEIEIGI